MKVNVEFSGGLELLFGKKTKLDIEFPDNETLPLRQLVTYLRDKELKEKPELFSVDETVRPGILVLINDTDWELLDGIEYDVQPDDSVVFISTLHGG